MSRLISAGVGMSRPDSSFRSLRLSLPIDTSAATCACFAALSNDLKLVSTFLAKGRLSFASRSSRKSSTVLGVRRGA